MLRLTDTLDDTYLVKTAELPGGFQERFREAGRGVGSAAGALLGAAAPIAIGAGLGYAGGDALADQLPALSEAAPTIGAVGGGAAGALLSPAAGLAGFMGGTQVGGAAGSVAGAGMDALRSAKNKAFVENRALPMAAAWHHIQDLKNQGAPDKILGPLSLDYNQRRHDLVVQGELYRMGRGL